MMVSGLNLSHGFLLMAILLINKHSPDRWVVVSCLILAVVLWGSFTLHAIWPPFRIICFISCPPCCSSCFSMLRTCMTHMTLFSSPQNLISIDKVRCPWCNGYCRRKWTWRHEFKSWMRLIAFHITLIPLGKVWIQLFSLQLWVK